MTQSKNQTTADPGAGIEILSTPAELDLTIGDGLVEQGYAAITRSARLLLLDLTRPVPLRRLRGSAPSSGSPTTPTRPGAVSASSRRSRRSRRYCGSAAWTAECRCSRPSTTHWISSSQYAAPSRPGCADRLEGGQQAYRARGRGIHHEPIRSGRPGGRSPDGEHAGGADHRRLVPLASDHR